MWLLFGAMLAASVLDRVDRRIVVLAGVGLTVARMLPLALATAGGELRRETVLLLGVGPRG